MNSGFLNEVILLTKVLWIFLYKNRREDTIEEIADFRTRALCTFSIAMVGIRNKSMHG